MASGIEDTNTLTLWSEGSTGMVNGITASDASVTIDSTSNLTLFGNIQLSGAGVDLVISGQTFEQTSLSVSSGAHLSIEDSTGVVRQLLVNSASFSMDAASRITFSGSIHISDMSSRIELANKVFDAASLTIEGAGHFAVTESSGFISSMIMNGPSISVNSTHALGNLDIASLQLTEVSEMSDLRLESVRVPLSLLISLTERQSLSACTFVNVTIFGSEESPRQYGALDGVQESNEFSSTTSLEIHLSSNAVFDGVRDFHSLSISDNTRLVIVGDGESVAHLQVIIAPTVLDGGTLIVEHVSIDAITAMLATTTSPTRGLLTGWSMLPFQGSISATDVAIRHATTNTFPNSDPVALVCQATTGFLTAVNESCFPDPCFGPDLSCTGHGHCERGTCVCNGEGTQQNTGPYCATNPLRCCSTCGMCGRGRDVSCAMGGGSNWFCAKSTYSNFRDSQCSQSGDRTPQWTDGDGNEQYGCEHCDNNC